MSERGLEVKAVNDTEGSSKKVRVVDRRKFTADGSPRGDASTGESVAPEPTSDAPSDIGESELARKPPRAEPSGSAAPSEVFLELVAMLAQQAELLLVGAEGLPAQPDQAKRLIDYLGALESKTEGNLTKQEAELLSNLTFQLRTMFVQANR